MSNTKITKLEKTIAELRAAAAPLQKELDKIHNKLGTAIVNLRDARYALAMEQTPTGTAYRALQERLTLCNVGHAVPNSPTAGIVHSDMNATAGGVQAQLDMAHAGLLGLATVAWSNGSGHTKASDAWRTFCEDYLPALSFKEWGVYTTVTSRDGVEHTIIQAEIDKSTSAVNLAARDLQLLQKLISDVFNVDVFEIGVSRDDCNEDGCTSVRINSDGTATLGTMRYRRYSEEFTGSFEAVLMRIASQYIYKYNG